MNKKRKDVGYGRPPADKQFKPGQSGNRKGRPKGAKNTIDIFNEILNSKVMVTDNDKKIKMSRRSVILTQTVSKAMKGDLKAVAIVFPIMIQSDTNNEEKQKVLEALRTDDKHILENFAKRIGGQKDDK